MNRSRKASKANAPVTQNHLCLDILMVTLFARQTGVVYRDRQKSVPLFERFFLQPLIPGVRISEFIFFKSGIMESNRSRAQKNGPDP